MLIIVILILSFVLTLLVWGIYLLVNWIIRYARSHVSHRRKRGTYVPSKSD